MKRMMGGLFLLFIFLSFVSSALAQSQLPQLNGVVTDLTQTLTTNEIQEIIEQEQHVTAQSAGRLHRIYVLLTPNLYGYGDSDEFGQAVFDANQLGTGDVLITVEFETHALVLINSTELDSYFWKNSPTCLGDWGTYVVNDVMPGYLGSGEFKHGIISGMQEVGKIVTQPAPSCQVEPLVIMPADSVSQQTEAAPESSFNPPLWLCFIVLLLFVLLLLYLASKSSGGSDSNDTYTRDYTPTYTWPSAHDTNDYSPPVPSRSRSSAWSSPSTGSSSRRSSIGTGGSSSRSSFSPSSSRSSSRSGKW